MSHKENDKLVDDIKDLAQAYKDADDLVNEMDANLSRALRDRTVARNKMMEALDEY